MLLIILAGAILLLIPIWPEKLLIVYAVLFWALMIAAYVLLFLVNRWRRADQKTVECPAEYRQIPGAFRRGGTAATMVLAVLAAISLVFVLVRTVSHAPAAMIDYAAADGHCRLDNFHILHLPEHFFHKSACTRQRQF